MADVSKKTTSNHNNLGAACYRCRGFRHACDREKPACSRCKRRGITCQYPEAAPTLKKLQKATETLSDRIKKFGELLKTGENNNDGLLNNTNFKKGISLQRLAQPRSTVAPADFDNSPSLYITNSTSMSVRSNNPDLLIDDDARSTTSHSTITKSKTTPPVVSTSSFSVYPCNKCYKDLQQCDLTLPSCSRCANNNFECIYTKTEPKANHVSQVLNTMNKVMDQWQDSIDKMAKDFAQKTRDFGQRVDQSFKKKPLPPFAWKITSTNKGLSVESNVNSFNDLSKLVDQFKRTMHITPRDPETADTDMIDDERHRIAQGVEIDDASSIHTSSGFSFGVWNAWSHPTNAIPEDYPVDINQELTDSLVELYCRTPCCSAIRLPIIDTTEFLARYKSTDAERRPSKVLIYAVCAMAARNAFQMHVWSKRPAHETPHYNMGKALSMAYCLKGREELAECFDRPTIDNCQAAFLLSYCNHQNGYPGVIYVYDWIAFTMAQELGLYDSGRVLDTREGILVWGLYYFNTWYRVLQGVSNSYAELGQIHPSCPLPPPQPKPKLDYMDIDDMIEPPQEMIDYYVYTEWYCLIQLQILRHDCMSRLLSAQAAGKHDTTLSADLLAMQDRLQAFYDKLPAEWKNPDLESIALDQMAACTPEPFYHGNEQQQYYHVDIHEFARFCILSVHVYYNINKILLYQAFFPTDHAPTSPFSLQSLYTCIDAAYAITQTLDIMVKHHDECNIPLLGFLFANMVYIKLLNYNDDQYQEFARRCLEQSINVSKMSKAYLYDFEMTRNLVNVMEQDIRNACGGRPLSVVDDEFYPFALPSPPTLPPFIQ
ncbi:uncharacterized protein BX663DRAFT_497563 [Cokeromyces recurvatus]|uniref:uncharacterized protein n=1 Tax=Cokeromyces recurvatus TaxID=90255 RepID=UPI00221F4A69|nr:uncharacterized protein BX663DRAFT_497563 [Cokeromyces recurvatus]KAI7906780.1 hypothetical protein BX663DRAFT_497563 [Cokeromyces recurvatus]